MCDYCERGNNNITIIDTESREVVARIEQEDLVVRYEDWICLGNGEWGCAIRFENVTINHCPMCGRELKGEK